MTSIADKLQRRTILRAGAMAMIAAISGPALAQSDPVDLAAAKREGKVVWYTSTPIEAAQKIAKLFEEETGIRVELFRSGGSAVCQSLRAGNHRRSRRGRRADHVRPCRLRVARQERAVRCRSSRRISTRSRTRRRIPAASSSRSGSTCSPCSRATTRCRRRSSPRPGAISPTQVQGQDGDARPVLHGASAHGRRHARQDLWLGVL